MEDWWFSADELARLGSAGIAGLPVTTQGCRTRANREGWESREVRGKGGPGGVKAQYRPDDQTLNLIKKHFGGVRPKQLGPSSLRPLGAGLENVMIGRTEIPSVTPKSPELGERSDYRVEGKDMFLMALAGAAIDMAFADLDLAGDMSVEERGKLAGALHDTFFDRREGVNARMMADFLIAAWRNSRRSSA